MAVWTPDFPVGFVIDLDTNTFIEQPPGNTKTVADVIAENAANQTPFVPAPKTTLSFTQIQAEHSDVEITDVDDILGESAYAEISNETPGPQQTGITDTYTKIDQFDTVGLSKNISVSGPNNNLTITKAGFYSIEYFMSYTGTANEIYILAVHVNDAEVAKSSSIRTVSAANDVGSVSNKAILQLAVNDVVDIRVKTNVAGTNNFTLQSGNFIIQKVR